MQPGGLVTAISVASAASGSSGAPAAYTATQAPVGAIASGVASATSNKCGGGAQAGSSAFASSAVGTNALTQPCGGRRSLKQGLIRG